MNRRQFRQPRAGFTVLEILFSLVLMALFFEFAGKLFESNMKLSSGSQQAANRGSAVDSALYQLRGDVWKAAKISVADPNLVELTEPDSKTIAWKIDADDALVRTDGSSYPERWTNLAHHWSMSADAASLTIHEGIGDKEESVHMVSQLLAERGRP